MTQQIEFNEIKVEKLSQMHNLVNFDCGDNDINQFLKNDALVWQEKKIATSFVFIYKDNTIGFFCCSSDSIRLKNVEKNELYSKSISEMPAIKIGRLGRDIKFKSYKFGEFILKWAIGYILEISDKLGVRFITIDSYPNKEKWYTQFGFIRNLHEQYDKKQHISMRFDLYNLKK